MLHARIKPTWRTSASFAVNFVSNKFRCIRSCVHIGSQKKDQQFYAHVVGLQHRMVARPTCSLRHQSLTSIQVNKRKQLANMYAPWYTYNTRHMQAGSGHGNRGKLLKARANDGTRFTEFRSHPILLFRPDRSGCNVPCFFVLQSNSHPHKRTPACVLYHAG